MIQVISRSPDETRSIAAVLGTQLQPGDVLLLDGELGAGKTTFVQGLARGLGVPNPVASPTFTLAQEYREGAIPLIHLDAYRLEDSRDVAALGFEDWIREDAVLVVEWPDRLGSLTPSERLAVTFEIKSSSTRRITLDPRGARWERRISGDEMFGAAARRR